MLPKLRVSLAAVIATCLAVLAASAGLLGTRADKNLPGLPEVSRPLMQEAIVEQAGSEHFQLLAYSRRADELERLKNLPVAPARAVVVYAERKQANAAAAAPAVGDEVAAVSTAPPPATDAPPAVVAGALAAVAEPAPSITAGAPTAPSPALEPATPATTAPPPAPAPTTVAKTEDAVTPLATGPAQTAPVAAVPPDAPLVANAPSADRVTPDVTSSLDKTLNNSATATRNPAAATARAHTPPPKKKKPRVAHVQRPAPTPSTGFPFDLPDTQTPQPPQPPPRQPSQQKAISLFGGNN